MLGFIFSVKNRHSLFSNIYIIASWLTSTSNTSSNTAHYFNKMIRRNSCLDLIHKLFSSGKTTCNSNLYFKTLELFVLRQNPFEFNACMLNLFQTNYRSYVEIFERKILTH